MPLKSVALILAQVRIRSAGQPLEHPLPHVPMAPAATKRTARPLFLPYGGFEILLIKLEGKKKTFLVLVLSDILVMVTQK